MRIRAASAADRDWLQEGSVALEGNEWAEMGGEWWMVDGRARMRWGGNGTVCLSSSVGVVSIRGHCLSLDRLVLASAAWVRRYLANLPYTDRIQ